MSCEEERIGHVSREGGGVFLFVLNVRLFYGTGWGTGTRRKDPDSPKNRISSRSVMIPRWLLAKISQKLCPSALLQMRKVRHKLGLYVLTGT